MNKAAFYAALRRRACAVFGSSLTRQHVLGVETIVDEGQRRGIRLCHLAAILAAAYHETGGAMQPVDENLNYSAKRLPQVWPARFPTVASAEPYACNPRKLANRVYGERLGNVEADDGWRYRGRGLAQITGKANYAKFGLIATPDQASDMATAVRILFDGMMQGLFTGRRLADFDTDESRSEAATGYRYAASRAIINSDVRQNGPKIEAYGRVFEKALHEAGYDRGDRQPGQGGGQVVVTFRPGKPKPAANDNGLRPAAGILGRLLEAIPAIFARWMR